MVKRLLDLDSSELPDLTAKELKQSILASEGRIICSENDVMHEPVGVTMTNAEVAKAFGADLILLNSFDCCHPFIFGLENETIKDLIKNGLPASQTQLIRKLKHYVGRPIGVNLEPVDLTAVMLEEQKTIEPGRICSEETVKLVEELGFDFVCLTGNPGTGVSNRQITASIQLLKQHFSGLIIAGKMHSAGVSEPLMTRDVMAGFIKAGADVILVPAVGTVPGFQDAELTALVNYAKEQDALVMSAIGTSQEGATSQTIETIAIRNKICGVDIQHIGDAGYGGLATVENIYAMSLAIRGIRHTLNRMARSVQR